MSIEDRGIVNYIQSEDSSSVTFPDDSATGLGMQTRDRFPFRSYALSLEVEL